MISATWMQKSTTENVYRKAKNAAKKLDSKKYDDTKNGKFSWTNLPTKISKHQAENI